MRKNKKCSKCKKCGCPLFRLLKKLFGIAFAAFAVLFAVFFFDLDGKLLFYVVEPFLKKHYDNMPRKDVLQDIYEVDKYPKYEYKV